MKKLSLCVSLIAFIEVLPFSIGLYNNSEDDLNVFLCGKGPYNDAACPLKTAAERRGTGTSSSMFGDSNTTIDGGVTVFKAGMCGPESVNTGACVYFQGTQKSDNKIGDSIVVQPRSGKYKGCIYYQGLEAFNNGDAIVWKYGNENGIINTNTPEHQDKYPYYSWGNPEGNNYCSGWKVLELSDTTGLNGILSEAVISGINIGPWNKQDLSKKYDYFNFKSVSSPDMYSIVPGYGAGGSYTHCKELISCNRPQYDVNMYICKNPFILSDCGHCDNHDNRANCRLNLCNNGKDCNACDSYYKTNNKADCTSRITAFTNLAQDIAKGDLSGVQNAINSNNNLLNQTDNNGSTPLIIAAMRNQYGIVNFLLSYATTKLDSQNSDGVTALSIAQKNGYQYIVTAIQTTMKNRLEELNNIVDKYNTCANNQIGYACGSAQPMSKYTDYSDNLYQGKAQIVQNIANCNQMNTDCFNWNGQDTNSAKRLSRLYSPLISAVNSNNSNYVYNLISNLPSSNSLSELDEFAVGQALVEAAKNNNLDIVKMLFRTNNLGNFYLYTESGQKYLTQAIALGTNSSTDYLKRMSR